MRLRALSSDKARSSRTETSRDWDRYQIIAVLHRHGFSLLQLSILNGYTRNTVRDALDRPYPKCERIIARALGLKPADIWPSRYVNRQTNRRARTRAARAG
jgi:Ner family transcriptional regulator